MGIFNILEGEMTVLLVNYAAGRNQDFRRQGRKGLKGYCQLGNRAEQYARIAS
jgi:hypothetical protein